VDGSVVVRYEKDIPEQNDAVQCGRFVRVKIETASDVDLNGLFICDSEKNSSVVASDLKFAPEIQNK
ncbi:MAG: 30S ribosomal protein S12 methylthiotransferase RimO, partial [Treponema sp.]|nr:30S ribosomal protein S12 methylthiotransferase RimO [Treponema sp.]